MWKENLKTDVDKAYKSTHGFFKVTSKFKIKHLDNQFGTMVLLSTLNGLYYKFKDSWFGHLNAWALYTISSIAGFLLGLAVIYFIISVIPLIARWNFSKKVNRRQYVQQAAKEEGLTMKEYISRFYQPILWRFDKPVKLNRVSFNDNIVVKNYYVWTYWFGIIFKVITGGLSFGWISKKLFKKQAKKAGGKRGFRQIYMTTKFAQSPKIVVAKRRWFSSKKAKWKTGDRAFDAKFIFKSSLRKEGLLKLIDTKTFMEVYKEKNCIPRIVIKKDRVVMSTRAMPKVHKPKSDNVIAGLDLYQKFKKNAVAVFEGSVHRDVAYMSMFYAYDKALGLK